MPTRRWTWNYYITRWRQEASSWRADKLETRCGRENSTQRRGPPGLRLSSPGERERQTAMSGGAGEINMLQSLFSLQLPLTHNPFNKVRGIFFLKSLCSSLLLRQYVFCMYMCIYAYLLCGYKTCIIWCRCQFRVVHGMISSLGRRSHARPERKMAEAEYGPSKRRRREKDKEKYWEKTRRKRRTKEKLKIHENKVFVLR